MNNDKPTEQQPSKTMGAEETRLAKTRASDRTRHRPAAATIAHADATASTIVVPKDTTELAATRLQPKADGDTALNKDLPQALQLSTTSSLLDHLDPTEAAQYRDKRILKERFVLLETLGSGGMGNVYLAKDLLRVEMEDSHPFVAIKVLNDECRRMPGALQSLQREAKKAQTLSHPNIVTVYDFDRDGDTAFITMEYIAGESLKDYLRKSPLMPYAKAMYVVERVARGLAYAHQQGFVHADIKPANIFLGEDGAVKILDFGIAKAFTQAAQEKRSAADDLTEGALTPAYASSEMLEGQQGLPCDDVYSLAVMAYEMMRGRHPFIGADGSPLPANAAQATQATVAPIKGLSRRHMAALRKGLAFKRAQRYTTAGHFIDAIKKRNFKKDLLLLSSAAVFSGLLFVAVTYTLDQMVPPLSSLKPELHAVAHTIREGDELLSLADVGMAHRLYSQAWELANDLTVADALERDKVHSIIRDRMRSVSNQLISQSQQADISEYGLREIYVALEFLQKDDLTSNERRIERAMADIEQRIAALRQQ